MLKDSVVVLVTGWLLFALAGYLSRIVAQDAFGRQVALKLILIAFALALIAIWKRMVPGTYGFQRPPVFAGEKCAPSVSPWEPSRR